MPVVSPPSAAEDPPPACSAEQIQGQKRSSGVEEGASMSEYSIFEIEIQFRNSTV